MVFFIVCALALPVVAAGAIFQSKVAVYFAAIIMAGVGVATGNPMYIMSDLMGVGIGCVIGLFFCGNNNNAKGIKDYLKTTDSPTLQTPIEADLGKTPQANTRETKPAGIVEYTPQEAKLIEKNLEYYKKLHWGELELSNESRKRFVRVAKGEIEASTVHEKAYVKYLNNLRTMLGRVIRENAKASADTRIGEVKDEKSS